MSESPQVIAADNVAVITGGASGIGLAVAESPIACLIGEMITSGVETGVPALDVADQVVAAVDAEQFWILTHEEMRARPVERMERAASQTNPPLLGAN